MLKLTYPDEFSNGFRVTDVGNINLNSYTRKGTLLWILLKNNPDRV